MSSLRTLATSQINNVMVFTVSRLCILAYCQDFDRIDSGIKCPRANQNNIFSTIVHSQSLYLQDPHLRIEVRTLEILYNFQMTELIATFQQCLNSLSRDFSVSGVKLLSHCWAFSLAWQNIFPPFESSSSNSLFCDFLRIEERVKAGTEHCWGVFFRLLIVHFIFKIHWISLRLILISTKSLSLSLCWGNVAPP